MFHHLSLNLCVDNDFELEKQTEWLPGSQTNLPIFIPLNNQYKTIAIL